jgi:hypothetical protein
MLVALVGGCGGESMQAEDARQLAEKYFNIATEAVPGVIWEPTEDNRPCLGGPGDGYDGTRRYQFSSSIEPSEDQIPGIVEAIRLAWETEHEVTVSQYGDEPAPSLYLNVDGVTASVDFAHPKDGHGWQVLVVSSSPCYEPEDS